MLTFKFTSIIIITGSILLSFYSSTHTVIPSVNAQNSEEDVISLNSKALEAINQGRYQEAIEYLDGALAIDPNDVNALYLKGTALSSLGMNQEAIEYFDRVLAIDPNDVDALTNKGVTLGSLGMNQEAIEYFDRVLAIDPNNIFALYNKGVALYNLGRYQEAIEYYDRVLAIDPNYVDALNNKGTALGELGRYEEAITYFDQVLSIDPNYRQAALNKGAALGNLGRHQEAAQYFETSSSIQESSINNVPTYNDNKGNYFVLISNVSEKGYYFLSSLLESDYTNLDVRLDNSNGYKGKYQLQYISHGYQIDVTAEVNGGISKVNTGDCQGAIVIFDEILRVNSLHPNEPGQQKQLAATLYNKGLCVSQVDPTGGQKLIDEAHTHDPNYEGTYIFEGASFAPPVASLIISEPSG
jgi:tetratricopeptide (TPR) repeat protein